MSLEIGLRDFLGYLLPGSVLVFGVFRLGWFHSYFRGIIFLDPLYLSILLILLSLIGGYIIRAVGFGVVSQLIKKWCGNPSEYLIEIESESPQNTVSMLRRFCYQLIGRVGDFDRGFKIKLRKKLEDFWGKDIVNSSSSTLFRLCWRLVERRYIAASEAPNRAFALRNLYLSMMLSFIFLGVAFTWTSGVVEATLCFILSWAFLREFNYFNGEWAKNVYHTFYVWTEERELRNFLSTRRSINEENSLSVFK